jgi:hypothetical protein
LDSPPILISLYDYCSPLPGKLFALKIFLSHVTQKFKAKIVEAREISGAHNRLITVKASARSAGSGTVSGDGMLRFENFLKLSVGFIRMRLR